MKKSWIAVFLGMLCLPVLAVGTEGSVANDESASPKADYKKAGQQSAVELDMQVGTFLGSRLKGIVYAGHSYNLAAEAMWGASLEQSYLAESYGAGLRGEFYLSNSGKHAWMISPGLDGYYSKAHPCPPEDIQQSVGEVIVVSAVMALCSTFSTPTRVISVAPNVDMNWLYQFNPHLGMVVGAQAGATVVVTGRRYGDIEITPQMTQVYLGDQNIAGKVFPDIGLYWGMRF